MRASEHAKRSETDPKHVLWIIAKDIPQDAPEFRIPKEQIDKKRARWLQYHDQQTSGIPGLLLIYKGMRARVTERISKKLKIWKHIPCRVIAWDLHPDDKQVSRDGERMLQELPSCIYVQFEGATWQVHKGLPKGVFPLTPVKRSWSLNRNTKGPKVDRSGYTLLPDYACTAHMVQ